MNRNEESGIEMQILGATGISDPLSRTSAENNNSNEMSQANSAISIDYPEQVTSTIRVTHYKNNHLLIKNLLHLLYFLFRFKSRCSSKK